MPRHRKTNVPSELSGGLMRTTRANSKAFYREAPQEEKIAEEITVRVTRAKSHTSSRPSTANSDAATSSSQQSRRRTTPAPSKDEDVEMLDAVYSIEEPDELAGSGPALKKPKPTTIKNVTASGPRKGRFKYDNPDEMLTNSKSPLATVNLRDLLCSPKAWNLLSRDEQQRILTLFPEKEVLDKDAQSARPNIAALRNNDNFRHDTARYQDGLSRGWHDPEWVEQAHAAHAQRRAGVYDEYLAARFQEDWGVPIPPQPRWEDHPVLGPESVLRSGSDGDDQSDAGKAGQPDQEGREEQEKPQEVANQEGNAKNVEDREEPDAMQGLESTSKEDAQNSSDNL